MYYAREHVGRGEFVRDGVHFIDTVPAGERVTVWMEETRPQPIEDEHVQRILTARGQVWCRCYSTLCPDGECAWIAVGAPGVVRVTQAAFEHARAAGWHACVPTRPDQLSTSEQLR